MIDKGHADRTLRMRPLSNYYSMCWTVALKKAASNMGFDHYLFVPMNRDDELRALAHALRNTT